MIDHDIDALLRAHGRHEPPAAVDQRIRRMIATTPHHAPTQRKPGPFTWRDWCHVALALLIGPLVILSHYFVLPDRHQVAKAKPQEQFRNDNDMISLCQAGSIEYAWQSRRWPREGADDSVVSQ